ncbi:hypothetical protein BHECKSOX_1461 [Bathymodiolus heckerae thiotrophic gill symbiont]|nr:hypothetical protein BHECKSOX_1461 [Bathymodiolus heckerae thiotrophic gill symbiont]
MKVAGKVPDQASRYLSSITTINDAKLHERMIEVMLRPFMLKKKLGGVKNKKTYTVYTLSFLGN